MTKGADAFRSIGEVARLLGVAPHVLRYWETQFPMLRPMKRADGRRYYRPEDVRLAAGLCAVLRDEGLTIRGARMLLARDRGAAVRERGNDRLLALLPSMPDATDDDASDDDASAADTTDDTADDAMSAPRSRLRRRSPSPTSSRPAATDGAAALAALRHRLRDPGTRRVLAGRDGDLLERLRDALARMC